jgi:DNA-3-methyladenine glycosylase II
MFTDPILNQLVKKYPPPTFTDRTDHLMEDLIESIISQQLSVKAADTIYKRFLALFNRHPELASPELVERVSESLEPVIPAKAGIQNENGSLIKSGMTSTFPTPQQILSMPDEALRSAGISFQKISYIKSVADAFLSDLIDAKKIKHMSDEEVIQALTQIRGVGKWTAEMILIFTLNRPDVFSIGDLGLRNAITKLYGITDQKEMLALSEKWKPHRSSACWYLWRSLENK